MMRWILASLVLSLAKGLLQANEGKLVNRHRHHLNRLDLQRRQALRRMARSTTNSPEQMLLANEEKLRSLDGVYDSLQDQRSHEREPPSLLPRGGAAFEDGDSMMASLSSQAEEAEDAPFIRAARQKRHDLALLQQTQDELQHLGFRSSKATKRLQKEASFPARKAGTLGAELLCSALVSGFKPAMFHPWPWRLLWLAVVVTHAQFTACVPGRYGRQCEHLCTCADYEECEDGPTGSGECSCMAGEEARCGLPSPPEGATAGVGLGTVDALVFQNLTLQALPLDPETARRSRQVFNASVSLTRPQPFRGSARLALLNPEVARRLGLAPELVDEAIFAELLSGKLPLPSTVQPFAHAYGGHQFGSWSGQLGDGRAMSLGHVLGFAPDQHIAEPITAPHQDSVRWWPWELSLKGAGKTPYSRGGDGRAALANAAREFFAPIFLESNGIPSCGTLAVLGSDAEEDRLARDEWYTGEMSLKKPGITLRAMPSFLRFGSAQLAAKRPSEPSGPSA
eukprot:g30376.t1